MQIYPTGKHSEDVMLYNKNMEKDYLEILMAELMILNRNILKLSYQQFFNIAKIAKELGVSLCIVRQKRRGLSGN